MPRVLIACLGAGLTGDFAVGAAVHALLKGMTLPEGVRIVLVPPGMTRLLQHLDGEEALVAVGEVEFGARPGTVHVLDWQDVPFGSDGAARNGHALRVTMEAVRLRNQRGAPRKAFLVGVEGRGPIGHGGAMRTEVAGALAGAARVALDLVGGLARLDDVGVRRLRTASPTPPGLLAAAH